MLRKVCLPLRFLALVAWGLIASTLLGCSNPAAPEAAPSAPESSATQTPSQRPSAQPTQPSPRPSPRADGVTRLLFLGNSHTSRNDVPGTVELLLRGVEPDTQVVAVLGPGSMHLEERGVDAETIAAITGRSWDFVVLQAQNYSTSGCCSYPTTGAEALVHLARQQRAVPVLYAEWARRGIEETDRIIEAYQQITEQAPPCLPPVPEAFDIALRRFPTLVLHDRDGNHSSPAGAFLASAVLASAISGRPAATMPALPSIDVRPYVQAQLRAVADDALAALPAQRAC
jgi:hypothetical protein